VLQPLETVKSVVRLHGDASDRPRCSFIRLEVPIIVPVVPRPVTKCVMRSPTASRIVRSHVVDFGFDGFAYWFG
jgi:hypothetical protein